MRILSMKPGHDGSIALIEDNQLRFSLEAEKDSFSRFTELTPSAVIEALALCDGPPDVLCLSGWVKGFHSVEPPIGAGYYGWDESAVQVSPSSVFGRDVHLFTSTHERSHLMSYGMSPYPQGQPCYALVWEGNIGSFYEIDEAGRVTRLESVLEDPGNKYQYVFALADKTMPDDSAAFRFENAGKLMALAAFADGSRPTPDETELIDYIMSRESIIRSTPKSELRESRFYNIGAEAQELKNVAARLSDTIFDRFLDFAQRTLVKGHPLLISGGCGLNCTWNTKWRETGLFSSVFVPPCTNDTGSAIGTAVDAQRHFTGDAKISWDVYAGEEFHHDVEPADFDATPLRLDTVAALLEQGNVLAWVQGRYEMGPRALGNRSILAAPFDTRTRDRLNAIKGREGYRPIAPVCREEEVATHMEWEGESPYMLHFQQMRSDRLAAVTHVDGTARAQTVRRQQNPVLHDLLTAFKVRTRYGVLCNTSLNHKGRGFINRTSDLAEYVPTAGLDGFVAGDRLYVPRPTGQKEHHERHQ
jgi:predicted NodU family carbamoyl transferase